MREADKGEYQISIHMLFDLHGGISQANRQNSQIMFRR